MEIRTIEGRFSEAFKLYVVEEIEARRMSQAEACRRYGILGHSTISKWFWKYGSLKRSNGTGRSKIMNREVHEMLRLENEIKALKRELDEARQKNVVLETFIDIAEKELGIPIRKKYGARQSERLK